MLPRTLIALSSCPGELVQKSRIIQPPALLTSCTLAPGLPKSMWGEGRDSGVEPCRSGFGPIVSGEVQSTHGSQLQDHVSYVQGLGHVRHCLALAASNCSEFVRVTSASGMFPMSSLLLLQCGHAQITGSRYPGRLSCLYPLHSPRQVLIW